MNPCLILCSQALDGVPGALAHVLHDAFGIAVDGGLAHFNRLKIQPELWIGDGDSVSPAQLKKFKGKRIKLAKKKSYSDLEFALHQAGKAFLEGEWEDRLILLGAQGGRFDHDLANLLVVNQWLMDLSQTIGAESCPEVHSYGPHGAWIATLHDTQFDLPKGRVFSMLTMGPSPLLSITGAKYTIKKQKFAHASHGLSNEGMGRTIALTLFEERKSVSSPVFVLIPH